jgi:hypothetical protein
MKACEAVEQKKKRRARPKYNMVYMPLVGQPR